MLKLELCAKENVETIDKIVRVKCFILKNYVVVDFHWAKVLFLYYSHLKIMLLFFKQMVLMSKQPFLTNDFFTNPVKIVKNDLKNVKLFLFQALIFQKTPFSLKISLFPNDACENA